MSNSNSNPTRILHSQSQDPNTTTADPHVLLQNLSLVRTRMDSLQHFLSQSINTNTPLAVDQIAMVSSQIVSSIHQLIVNGSALVSYSQNSTAASGAPDPPLYPKKPEPEPSVADKAKQILDSKFGPLEDDDDDDEDGDVEDFDDGSGIVELDAIEILAEHMHFCEICAKGFRRDSNLRMHMRAHGEQFKTVEALAKPSETTAQRRATRFSCPFEGCNRNKLHRRFRPLKSVICVNQAEPLPEDVHVRAVPQEALLGSLGFEEPREALRRRGQVEVHVRDHVLEKGQIVWSHCAV